MRRKKRNEKYFLESIKVKKLTVNATECIALLHKTICAEEISVKMIICRKPKLAKEPKSHAVIVFK